MNIQYHKKGPKPSFRIKKSTRVRFGENTLHSLDIISPERNRQHTESFEMQILFIFRIALAPHSRNNDPIVHQYSSKHTCTVMNDTCVQHKMKKEGDGDMETVHLNCMDS